MLHRRECPVCNLKFDTKIHNKIYCSLKCQISNKPYKTQNKIKITTSNSGTIAELMVCNDFLNNGYDIYRSVSPSCFCDLIAHKNGVLYKVEVKTGYERKPTSTNKKRFHYPKHSNQLYDIMAVVVARKYVAYINVAGEEITI